MGVSTAPPKSANANKAKKDKRWSQVFGPKFGILSSFGFATDKKILDN